MKTCKECEECRKCLEKGGQTLIRIIVIPIAAVCITVIILVAVILALYWKFKIKLVRESKNTEGLERFVHLLDRLADYHMHTTIQERC
jgi:uncharacterized membrane protein YedE/YeeE